MTYRTTCVRLSSPLRPPMWSNRLRHARLLAFGALGACVACAPGSEDKATVGAEAPEYPSIEASSHEDPNLRFVFSAADATSSDPVVISVAGRDLKIEDGEHRVSLQKYWVSQQFKNEYRVVQRYSTECDLKRPKEISGCDVYVVKDELTQQQFTYYIYMGNWPHLYR